MLIKITISKQGMRIKTDLYIGRPKELWKSLKTLGLKFELSISSINWLENYKSANFDIKDIAKDVRVYFSNLAKNHVAKLPNLSKKYSVPSAAQYYSNLGLTKKLIYYQQKKIMYLRFWEMTPIKLLAFLEDFYKMVPVF